MKPNIKKFHLGDILSITTGKLVTKDGKMDGIYKILSFMTDSSIKTHQIPRAIKTCQPYLLKQHTQLESVDASRVSKKNGNEWLQKQIEKFGEYLEVKPLPANAYEIRNPILELAEMMGERS